MSSLAGRILSAGVVSILLCGSRTVVAQPSDKVQFNPNRRAHAEQDVEETSGAPEDGAEKKKAPKSPGFTKYSRMFLRWCQLLDKDGRKESMFTMLDYISDEFTECPGCRGFIRGFAFPCKPKPKPLTKRKPTPVPEGEPTPEPTVTPVPARVQREPNTELLDAISKGLIEIREDPKRINDAAVAVERLVKELRDPQHKSPGERDYFDVLAEYFHAPLIEFLEKPVDLHGDPQAASPTPTPPQIDDLFGS